MEEDMNEHFFDIAMSCAQSGAGFVNPNPMVGAVIVRGEQILATGFHARYGDLHAERAAFREADARGIDCKGASMYVTLEPCCHYGKQPPCTLAIIEHQIAHVYVGLTDPNPLVAGKGIRQLREAGIEVTVIDQESPLAHRLRYQNRAFLKYITTQRPWVLAKYAMTLDGKICTCTGDSQWVSCEASRERVHQLRHEMAAILVGIGTVLADNPMLNTRLTNQRQPHHPIRIIADRKLRLPLNSQLVKTAHEIRTIVAHDPEADESRQEALANRGIELWPCRSLGEMLDMAGRHKISSILLEGGGTLNEAFMREHLIDEVYAFIAPKMVGGATAKSPVEGQGLARMNDALEWEVKEIETIDKDILIKCLQASSKK